MSNEPSDVQEIIAVLQRTPETVRALLQQLPDRLLTATEGEKTWSPFDVVGHLIHGERTDWIPRVHHILAGKTEPFPKFDREAQFTESRGLNIAELLDTFAQLRNENLSTLTGLKLTNEDLARRGIHPSLGEVTLGQLLATWVVHDLDHIGQVSRIVAKAYGSAVGPWSQYLSILHDRDN